MLSLLSLHPVNDTILQEGKHRYKQFEVIDPETNKKVMRYFNLDLTIGERQ